VHHDIQHNDTQHNQTYIIECCVLLIVMLNDLKLSVVTPAPNSKGLFGTNALAYLLLSSVTERKSFVTLTPGPNVMKLFAAVSYDFL
jgi:hypothetical protein